MPSARSNAGGLWLLAALIVAAFVVPYTVLRGMPVWHGAFLFWSLFGLAAIAVILGILARWRP
ncbi:hypothetical protein [Sediminicurvatus halobius]|uniref:DUF4175 domain-containing protein n=1 Tax=Sediminicurvatus halobius TaxID=2182432 RepID=A0A2U2N671_9GAMM|nr:hypothetical protein [Spiribacter halobius]PWG64583.1 hypothetical protein DEM34_04445 [Spiribacter halobius]UEX79096.1 hypothetical protein LMH63_05480 [Spiribacter halobius]